MATKKGRLVNVKLNTLEEEKMEEMIEKFGISISDIIRMGLWRIYDEYLGTPYNPRNSHVYLIKEEVIKDLKEDYLIKEK